jgi:hypothetical protein
VENEGVFSLVEGTGELAFLNAVPWLMYYLCSLFCICISVYSRICDFFWIELNVCLVRTESGLALAPRA